MTDERPLRWTDWLTALIVCVAAIAAGWCWQRAVWAIFIDRPYDPPAALTGEGGT